jgi:Flp pilus assembly protein TadG
MDRSRLRLRRGRASSRGQSLVEFALVFPLFILLVAGMIDFGMGLYSYMTINNAARDAARLGATMCTANPCAGAVKARVTANVGGLGIDAPVVTCRASTTAVPAHPNPNCTSGTALPGDDVIVNVTYTYRMIWPLAFGNTISMSSQTTMLAE